MTLWFNGAVAAIAVLWPQIEAYLPMLQAILPASLNPYLVAVLAIGNALLRLRTAAPITQAAADRAPITVRVPSGE